MTDDLVYSEVRAERQRQDAQWGGQRHDSGHGLLGWLGLLAKHQGKLAAAIFDEDWGAYRRRLVIVASLAIAAAETYDALHDEAAQGSPFVRFRDDDTWISTTIAEQRLAKVHRDLGNCSEMLRAARYGACDSATLSAIEALMRAVATLALAVGEQQLPSISARQAIGGEYPHRQSDNCPCMACWPPKKWSE